MNYLLELAFDMELAKLSPTEFLQKYLYPLNVGELVIGYDFRLGKGRAGDFVVLKQIGLDAYRALGCRGVTRVDFRVDAESRPYVLELNTSPGFTSHSLVPKAGMAKKTTQPGCQAPKNQPRAMKPATESIATAPVNGPTLFLWKPSMTQATNGIERKTIQAKPHI